jgi:phosphopantothenoylcysteine decarboxylase / phosphopantothenate---cysteine ligase
VRFLVTAGPTREPIDPVRYLSNRSSGKMGYAIAEAAIEAGHQVVLISGPVQLEPPQGAKVVSVLTADEMHNLVHTCLAGSDVVVMCAAVADYKPAKTAAQKIKKANATLTLDLIPTIDILVSLGEMDRDFLLVGFAAETNNVEQSARKKLREKNCDIIIANDVSHEKFGMESDENEITILFRTGETRKIPRASKKILARELVKIFSKTRQKRLTKKMS